MTRAEELTEEASRRGSLNEPIQLVFRWSLNESGSRLAGRGVARMAPPYRVRLDLFTEQGETAARAVLVDEDLRVPPDADPRLVPPAPLLWAALGIFRPGDRALLLGAEVLESGAHLLRYEIPGGREVRYEVAEDGALFGAELLRNGRTVEWVRVARSDAGSLPTAATYRDLTAFRELRVETESVERVEGHDPAIWGLGR